MNLADLAAQYQSSPKPDEFDDPEELRYILEDDPGATREKSLEIMDRYLLAEKNFMDKLRNIGLIFDRIGSDEYDNSVELLGVDNQQRLTPEMQELIFNEGFATAYFNHRNHWETHYTWDHGHPFAATQGFRVSYGHKNQCGKLLVEVVPENWKMSQELMGRVQVVSPLHSNLEEPF